jgi:hypothetical protein
VWPEGLKNPPHRDANPKPSGLFKIFYIILLIFYYFVGEAIGTAAIPGLLCQPRVIVKMIV